MRLRISEVAALAILDQADYYRETADALLADRWEAAVDEAIRSLTHSPERGAPCRLHHSSLSDLRWVLVPGFPRHMIFYRCTPAGSDLLIVHVLHGARNLEPLLNQDQE
jgi:toxin ParE1/3/4